jgi:uncharacterized protein YndB with AHSA1/START domain
VTDAGVIRVSRSFAAPIGEVFDAWTNPDVMALWWHPGRDWQTPLATVDLRVGGAISISLRAPDGREIGWSGVYTDIDAPNRVAFTFTWAGEEDSPAANSLVEVTFTELAGVTTVELVHRGYAPGVRPSADTQGWTACFDNLNAILAKGAPT